jgi:hypothetical protein
MADGRFYPIVHKAPGVVLIEGNFSIAATMSPALASGMNGVTVSKTAAGKYRVTWSQNFLRFLCFKFQEFRSGTTTAALKKTFQGGALVTGSNYAEIWCRTDDTGVITNPLTNTIICYSISFQNSGAN